MIEPQYLLALGIALLIGEVLLGFSVIFLLTLGLSTIVVAALTYWGLFESTIINAFLAVSVVNVVVTTLLWAPMKKLQRSRKPKSVSSDLIGNSFELSDDVTPSKVTKVRYSGVDWGIKSSEALSKGEIVTITAVEVGYLTVKREHDGNSSNKE